MLDERSRLHLGAYAVFNGVLTVSQTDSSDERVRRPRATNFSTRSIRHVRTAAAAPLCRFARKNSARAPLGKQYGKCYTSAHTSARASAKTKNILYQRRRLFSRGRLFCLHAAFWQSWPASVSTRRNATEQTDIRSSGSHGSLSLRRAFLRYASRGSRPSYDLYSYVRYCTAEFYAALNGQRKSVHKARPFAKRRARARITKWRVQVSTRPRTPPSVRRILLQCRLKSDHCRTRARARDT